MTWPKLKRDWTGRIVILKRELRTNSGVRFRQGSRMTIEGYYRGLRLHSRHGCITRVPIYDVTLTKFKK